jgi:polysaccharide biosynthesis protein PelD
VSDIKSTWKASWTALKGWGGTSGLPVLPPIGALVELAVLVLLIVLAEWAFPSVGIITLEPSPFWVPVLLLSLQYGTVAGLLAAAAATAAYVFNGMAEQAIGENFFSYLLRIWALPILWIGVALVLGQFRLRQIAEKLDLRQNLAKRTAEAQTLAGYATDLESRCQRLERQLTTRSTEQVKPVLEALAQVAGPAGDIDRALDTITRSLWPGAQVSVFAVTPTGCELFASSGWSEAALWATEFSASHPLYRSIVGERRPVSIFNRSDEALLSGNGVAAHPIVMADGGRVIGMFKVEVITPELIEPGSDRQMALIARLLALGLSEPRIVVDNEAREGARDVTGLRRLTDGWRIHHWRAMPANSPQSKTQAAETSIDETERPAWPRHSS